MSLRIRPRRSVSLLTACALAATPLGFGLGGCESLPGEEEEQGAVIGGAGGALAGAAIYEDNRALGALIGGLLGAGGGYIAGTQINKNEDEAREAAEEARQNPATAQDARQANSADLDGNGFVTMDELTAMQEAGLSSDEIIRRAEATEQVFELQPNQQNELRAAGYDTQTLQRLQQVNRDIIENYPREDTSDRVSQPRYN